MRIVLCKGEGNFRPLPEVVLQPLSVFTTRVRSVFFSLFFLANGVHRFFFFFAALFLCSPFFLLYQWSVSEDGCKVLASKSVEPAEGVVTLHFWNKLCQWDRCDAIRLEGGLSCHIVVKLISVVFFFFKLCLLLFSSSLAVSELEPFRLLLRFLPYPQLLTLSLCCVY